MSLNQMLFSDIDIIVFDFDGVLTNNKVFFDENGKESVMCDRSDGLAFDVLRKLKMPAVILSSEKNLVVEARAKKLKIPSIQGAVDKVDALKSIAISGPYILSKILYIGNDLNDFEAMNLCGYSACPSDSHNRIKTVADIVLDSKGGEGVVRELLEVVFKIDFLEVLYKN
jgi:3-deoxy-D-manno-octulosonate 8-phosphate phosphatase (KDO 8-P phosphatase)